MESRLKEVREEVAKEEEQLKSEKAESKVVSN